MLNLLSDKIREHLIKNPVTYILLTVFFSLGVVGGAYIYNQYSPEEVNLLYEFFEKAKELYANEEVNSALLFKNSFLTALKSVSLIWISGFTVIGIPLIFFTLMKKGFILGLITNFLLTNFKGGILLSVILMFLQTVVLIPALMVISTYGISLSKTLLGLVFGKIKYKLDLKNYLLFYLGIFIVALLVAVVYALLEGYFTGNVLKWYFKS